MIPCEIKKSGYLEITPIHTLHSFFASKGIHKLKEEDKTEEWYSDFEKFLRETRLYAKFLSPKAVSSQGNEFDFLTLCKFLETFAYHSPAHAYSFQVSYLGIFPILMSKNLELKKEAVKRLENGGLFAFGLSEKEHGSDIYSSEMRLTKSSDGKLMANGSKYYIGNANCAEIISVLAVSPHAAATGKVTKNDFTFFALRAKESKGFKLVKKIHTLGVRQAFVGGFDVIEHPVSADDIASEGENAWSAIFGTVNIGKFFLGFGSVGICEHAYQDALKHVSSRILYGRPVVGMPHIRKIMTRAYARLLGMKLYAYRAIDYLQCSSETDRRYLLTNSVQKAKVSTEAVTVMQLLSECIGAKGFESDTAFEMALRDASLIPGLEGSTHINFAMTGIFLKNYFFGSRDTLSMPEFHKKTPENPYIFEAKSGGMSKVQFPDYEKSFEGLAELSNVKTFIGQMSAFKIFLAALTAKETLEKFTHQKQDDVDITEWMIEIGKLFSTFVYGQLIAEKAAHEKIDTGAVNFLFGLLVEDVSTLVVKLAGQPELDTIAGMLCSPLLKRMIEPAEQRNEDIDSVFALVREGFGH